MNLCIFRKAIMKTKVTCAIYLLRVKLICVLISAHDAPTLFGSIYGKKKGKKSILRRILLFSLFCMSS